MKYDVRNIRKIGKAGFALVLLFAVVFTAMFAIDMNERTSEDGSEFNPDEDEDTWPFPPMTDNDDKMTTQLMALHYMQYAAVLILLMLAAILFRSIVREHRPFTVSNVRLLRFIAFAETALGIVSMVMTYVFEDLHMHQVESLMLLSMGIVSYSISLIFKYGLVLQTESDETL